jgi:hypothetical protein
MTVLSHIPHHHVLLLDLRSITVYGDAPEIPECGCVVIIELQSRSPHKRKHKPRKFRFFLDPSIVRQISKLTALHAAQQSNSTVGYGTPNTKQTNFFVLPLLIKGLKGGSDQSIQLITDH